jgi:predicted enzyme related to lactoylglutathione lyase
LAIGHSSGKSLIGGEADVARALRSPHGRAIACRVSPQTTPERARRFWEGLLGVPFAEREDGEGSGWQTREGGVALGLHERGPGPGDRFSLPYFAVADVGGALARVKALGGEVVHPGERWTICRDSEASPFGLARS